MRAGCGSLGDLQLWRLAHPKKTSVHMTAAPADPTPGKPAAALKSLKEDDEDTPDMLPSARWVAIAAKVRLRFQSEERGTQRP